MIEAEQLKYKLNSFQEPLEDLSGSLALEAKKERIDQLELNMEEPGFWVRSMPVFRRPRNFLHSPVSTSSAKLDKVLFFNSIQNTPFLSDKDKKDFVPDMNFNNYDR